MSFLLTMFVAFLLMGMGFIAFMMHPVLTIAVIAAIVIVMMFPIQVIVVLVLIVGTFAILIRD